MRKGARRPRFPQKLFSRMRTGLGSPRYGLDRDRPPKLRIGRQEYATLGAAPDLPDDTEAADCARSNSFGSTVEDTR
jgi:hypothetical protein